MIKIAFITALAATAAAMHVDEPAATSSAALVTPTAPPTLTDKGPSQNQYIQAVINEDGSVRVEGTMTTVDFDILSKGFSGNVTHLRSAVDAYLASKGHTDSLSFAPEILPNAAGCRVEWVEWVWGPFDYWYWDQNEPCLRCSGTHQLSYSEQNCWGLSVAFGGEWAKKAFGVSIGLEGSYQNCIGWQETCNKEPWGSLVCVHARLAWLKKNGTAKFHLACGNENIPLGETPQEAGQEAPQAAAAERGATPAVSYRTHTEYVEAYFPQSWSYRTCKTTNHPACW
ncbi:hypothetical protein HDU96_009226 [Phlyctochytrium bullatum]|nr:hypothetical protein HDU96_009226 [Phlyctochytrium bullatum]